jgi:hypothetical protein
MTGPGTAMEVKPTIGRIVHYCLENGQQRPAIVTSADTEEIHLLVFCDINDGAGFPTVYKVGVPFNSSPKAGTWHWPERLGGDAG